MGACATKPKVKEDEPYIPAPEPKPEPTLEIMMKSTEEVKVVQEDKKVDGTNQKIKKEDTKKIVVEEEKAHSLSSLLVEVYD